MMTIDTGTFIGFVSLAGGALAVGGGWVVSVEKRINGLKYLHGRVKEIGETVQTIDNRTAQILVFVRGREALRRDE